MTGAFDHLESDLAEKPLFVCEEPGKPGLDPKLWPEEARQRAFVSWIRGLYGVGGLHTFSVANERKGSAIGGERLKRNGLTAGVPDIVVLWDGGIAFCEFKGFSADRRPGKLSQAQIETCNRIHRNGWPVGCFYTAKAALAFIAEHGAPVGGNKP